MGGAITPATYGGPWRYISRKMEGMLLLADGVGHNGAPGTRTRRRSRHVVDLPAGELGTSVARPADRRQWKMPKAQRRQNHDLQGTGDRKVEPTMVAPHGGDSRMVTMFISAFCAVSLNDRWRRSS